MRGFKTVRSNMPALIDERKSFHYTITTTENKNNDASFLGALKKIVNIYFFLQQYYKPNKLINLINHF